MFSKSKIAILAVAFILLTAPFVAYFLSPADSSGGATAFSIEKGYGVKEIARALKEAHLIKSEGAFLLFSALSGSAHTLKAGSYELSPAMSLPAIVRALKNGPIEDIAIFVREGEKLSEIEKKLVDAKILKKGDLSKFPGRSLEGFLFPDTYRFFRNSSAGDVVKKFLSNFNSKAVPVLSKSQKDFYKTLVMASIIEKEVPFQEDRHLVAGLLYKRLEIGMPLQVDAYPWTYDHYGLPSKPIANPGIGAILAAANPKPSEYLYYLSDPTTKKTIFSKTFEEHKENKWKYLKR
jgi:UPF0755 protein